MREYFLDDPTGVEDNAKQEALDLVKFNIEQMLDYADESTVVDEVIYDVALHEIDDYLLTIVHLNPSLRKDVKMTRVFVDDFNCFSKLCEYTEISAVESPKNWNQRVYFLETEDSAISIIPIELDSNRINLHIEPLESSPDFITQMWAENRSLVHLDTYRV